MKFLLLAVVLACVVLLERKRRIVTWYRQPTYMRQIDVLRPDRLLALPPIKPLQGRKVERAR